MLIRLFIVIIIPGILLASPQYQVKLAVYKNLHTLQKKIAKLPPKLSKTIQVIQVGSVHKASSYPTEDMQTLKTLLPSYQKVFSDAFIGPVVVSASSPVLFTIPQKSTPIPTPKLQKKLSFSAKFKEKIFYLCRKEDNKGATLLIKVVFTDNTVTYTPLIGKLPPVTALYKIEGDTLHMYQAGLFNNKVYSILEKSYEEYHLLSSWIKDKKINDLRYYFTLNHAKQYLNQI